ncbi:MAG TPA: C40 family peptidase [Chthonomonadaceae bacterium]|jgi:hypothetical protein|nr:C40 family peptidase [Chthonomonadaceae bacterium]
MEPRYGVITHNVVAMRAQPNGSAEQVSQAILGESVLLLEERGGYVHIQTPDAYEGWALRHHLRPYAPSEPHWPLAEPPAAQRMGLVSETFACLFAGPGDHHPILTRLVFGTWALVLDRVRKADRKYLQVAVPGGTRAGAEDNRIAGYVYEEALLEPDSFRPFRGGTACVLAEWFIGTPYLWGGTTPFGFDCSGFVQRIYSALGVTLPRDAYLQAKSPLGVPVPEGEPLQAGDLVFFCGDSDPRGRGITHVGMALDAKCFIHASDGDGVAITPHDDPYYARIYRGAWRYRPTEKSP